MCTFGKDFMLDFIETFKSEECLWKIACKDYHNKRKKEASYNLLLEKIKTVDSQATRDTVTRKINSLRSAFRKEFRKVKSVEREEGNEVYEPKLWYYEKLLFLVNQDQETTFSCESSMDHTGSEILENETADFQDDLSNSRDNLIHLEYPSVLLSSAEEVGPEGWTSSPRTKKRKVEKPAQDEAQMEDASACSNREDPKSKGSKDECDLFCELLCFKLRALGEDSRDLAMHEINNLMFKIKQSNKRTSRVQQLNFETTQSSISGFKSSPKENPIHASSYESDCNY